MNVLSKEIQAHRKKAESRKEGRINEKRKKGREKERTKKQGN